MNQSTIWRPVLTGIVAAGVGFWAGRSSMMPGPPSVESVQNATLPATSSEATGARQSSPAATQSAGNSERSQVRPVAAANESAVPISVEELKTEMEAIQSAGWMGLGGVRRTSALIERLAVSDLGALAAQMTSGPNTTDHTMGLHFVMNAYAERDPDKAWQVVLAMPAGQARQSAMSAVAAGIASRDPARAMALADSVQDTNMRNQIRTMVIAQQAAKDPREALRMHLANPETSSGNGRFDSAINMIFHQWARQNLEEAKNAASQLTGNAKEQASSAVLQSFAQADPVAAWKYALSLPASSDTYSDPRLRVIQIWSNSDPLAAMNAAKSLENSALADMAVNQALSAWSRVDFDAALDYALSVPNPTQRSDLFRALANNSGGDRKRLLKAVLDYMPPGNSFQQAVSQIFSNWASENPKAAADAIFDLPPGQVLSNAASQVAAQWANSGSRPEVLAWVRQLPEGETRLQGVDAVFRQWAVNDLAGAQGALGNLSGAERERAVVAFASGWSQRDPQAVIRWAESLASGDEKNSVIRNALSQWANSQPEAAARMVESLSGDVGRDAMSTVVSQWASKDALSAGNWLEKQSPGPPKDAAIAALSRTVATEDPEQAIVWAMQIQDERQRRRQIENHARTWIRNEPTAGRAWVQSSNLFTQEVKNRLLGQQ